MKILAVIQVADGADGAKLRGGLVDELRGSWQLFSSGVLREAHATEDPMRVVFVLEAPTRQDAMRALEQLPFVATGLVRVELTELRPFVNWSLLFKSDP